MTRALHELANAGVSVWLDDLSRDRLDTGGLVELIHDFHVVGVTTNPTIFATAIDGSTRYDDQLVLLARHGADADAAVRALTVQDVTTAADLLSSVAQASDGVDGRVSLEVDPRLAEDTEATLAQARELWQQLERPNVFIKIPATAAGLPAIRAATAEGISVNATLIFSRARHRAVMSAYLDGIRDRLAAGGTVTRIASVASFFVSRVDTAVDGLLERRGDSRSLALRGQAAIANARLAYREAQSVFSGERWETLARQGARPQRPLWASTSVKNPAYPDTMYVTELVAAGTVNTMPEATLRAVADHGEVTGDTITSRYDDAERVLADLADVGIDLHEVTRELEEQGVAKFAGSWRELLDTVAGRLATVAS